MRLSIFLCKILQTLAILLCSELLFLPLLCSLGLLLLACVSFLLFCVRQHPLQAAMKIPEAERPNSMGWSRL
jgi:hypothetical protein